MKQILCFLLTTALGAALRAQQLPLSSLYEAHGAMHNPATAGATGHAVIGGGFRTQWSAMPGAPKTAILYGSAPVGSVSGVGGYLFNDVAGPLRSTGLEAAYAFIIPLKNNARFSLGIEGRVEQFSIDRQKLALTLGDNDPAINGRDQRVRGDAGFGVALTSPAYQVGVSVSQLVQSKLQLAEGVAGARFYRHYYFHGWYDIGIDENTHVIPNLLYVYLPNAPGLLQGGVRVEHNKLFWWGLSLRSQQSWMFSAGVHIHQRFSVAYSFDIYEQPLSLFDGGSNGHEVGLRYEWK
jgi:type IX secretion system PorP/SprF family membrane protein